MNPLGAALLIAALLGGVGLALRPQSRTAALGILVAWWSAVVFLGQRFVVLDLSLREVVNYSRAELSLPLRFAGLWAGPAGSLLMWCAVTFTAVLIPVTWMACKSDGPNAATAPWLRMVGLIDVVAVAVVATTANPFTHDTTNPVNGQGLSPVLEHPAMLIHPPLLYTAHAAVLLAAVLLWIRPESPGRRAVIGTAVALLVSATMLGAWWAHDELGWGGWWAWDPVENTALAPLTALVAALHSTSRSAARRWAMGAASLVLVGVAAARSGLASSVHAFAPSPGPSIAIGVAGAILAWLAVRGVGAEVGAEQEVAPPQPRWRRWVAVVLSLAAGWVAMVVVSAEVGAAWLGSREPAGTLDGGMVGRLLVPVGVVVVIGLVLWGWRVRRFAVMVAHLGVLLFAVGVVASIGEWRSSAIVDFGTTTELHGIHVAVGDREATEDRVDITRVEVPVTIDGHRYQPAILRYRDLERSRSRPARNLDWRGETEVVITYVDATRARVEVRRHPGLAQVWSGGALIIIGAAALGMAHLRTAIPLSFGREQRVD